MQLLCSLFDHRQPRLTVTQWNARTHTGIKVAHGHTFCILFYFCGFFRVVYSQFWMSKPVRAAFPVTVCAVLQKDACYPCDTQCHQPLQVISFNRRRSTLAHTHIAVQEPWLRKRNCFWSDKNKMWLPTGVHRELYSLEAVRRLHCQVTKPGENFSPVPPVFTVRRICIYMLWQCTTLQNCTLTLSHHGGAVGNNCTRGPTPDLSLGQECLDWRINLMCMCKWWRKPENPDETHTSMGGTCTPHTARGNSANRCTTLLLRSKAKIVLSTVKNRSDSNESRTW